MASTPGRSNRRARSRRSSSVAITKHLSPGELRAFPAALNHPGCPYSQTGSQQIQRAKSISGFGCPYNVEIRAPLFAVLWGEPDKGYNETEPKSFSRDIHEQN